MKFSQHVVFALSCIIVLGCEKNPEPTVSSPVQTPAPVQPQPTPNPVPVVSAPPPGNLVAANVPAPDPLDNIKQSKDGSPNKTDLEALQAVVDGYAFGVDGLGAPAIPNLEALVAKGILKKIPNPPPGKKWAYDSAKWKVSLVDQ